MNLLDETKQAIMNSGHEPADIIFIGSQVSGYRCTWKEFCGLADQEYDDGFGAAQVADDLRIVFADGQQMWRGEYDGSEWWYYSVPFIFPSAQKPIRSVFAPPEKKGWCSLAEIHGEEDV